MKAARIHRYGGHDEIRIDDVELPSPGATQVRVKIAAAAVNPIDWKISTGAMQAVLPLEFPYTLGCDLAGTVEAVGEAVQGFSPGDAVFGYPHLMRSGAFAEATLIEANELAHAPKSIPLDEVAALPVAAITAWDGLMVHGGIEAGQKIVVLGGAGGVGSAAIQLARWRGAEVFATTSPRNIDFVRSLGATVIDYTSQQVADIVRDADIVFDTVGPVAALEAVAALKPGGLLISSVYALPDKTALEPYKIRTKLYGIIPSGERLREIAAIVDGGHLRLAVQQVYPLHELPAALAASQSGRTRGKLLIKP
jgi:NADPH:quinone reductase-like Zn-dependent oxidoreductase